MDLTNEMGVGSFGEAGGGDEFEFMLDVPDLLANNNIETPSDENMQSYLTNESVELPPFPGSNLLQVRQISSNHLNECNNYEGLENFQLENNSNLVQLVETSSLNPSLVQPILQAHNPITAGQGGVLHSYDHEADAAQAENVLQPQNMSLNRTQESIQGCVPIYVDHQSLQNMGNNYFGNNNQQVLNCGSLAQNTVGVKNGNSPLVNQQVHLTWVPQEHNCPYDPFPQSGTHKLVDHQVHQGSITTNVYDPWSSNSIQPQPHLSSRLQQLPIEHQELAQVPVTPTVVVGSPPCFSAPFQMILPFGPQMQTTQNVFYPQSHNATPYAQSSMISRPHQLYGHQGQGRHIRPGVIEPLHQISMVHRCCMQPRPPEAQFQGFDNQPNEGAQQIQIVVSMPQGVHFQVSLHESAGPSVSNLNQRPSNQIQIFVSGLQEVQPQGFPTQTAGQIAHNPIQGIYQQNQFMQTEQHGIECLNLQVSVPQLLDLEGSSSTHSEHRRLAQAQHAHPRPQTETGESSNRSRKRVARRDHQVPLGLNPQQVSDIFQSQGTEAQDNKRRILNHLYDPLYEGTGLPIDPHLRLFVPKNKNDMVQ